MSKATLNSMQNLVSENERSNSPPMNAGKSDIEITAKLNFLIVCRFEKLTTEQQAVLRHGAVIGIEFPHDALAGKHFNNYSDNKMI